jgi:hypothetical protein
MFRSVLAAATLAAVLAIPGTPEVAAQAISRPDFLFQRPGMSLTLRGGAFLHRGESGVFDFAVEHLTVDRSDFRAGSIGGELGLWIGERAEIMIGADAGQVTVRSESRDWVEENGDPILQRTRLRSGPHLALGVKGYILPRGDAISRFSWVPARANAFAGGGVGVGRYEFHQSGDFVDEEEQVIFPGNFVSSGSTFFPFLTGGVEFSLTPRASLVGEARYLWGQMDMQRDFAQFDPIDLAGLRLTAGLAFRF